MTLAGIGPIFLGYMDRRDGLAVAGAILLSGVALSERAMTGACASKPSR